MITLAFAADLNMDGLGSQLQKQAAIYSLAKHLGLDYLHCPIVNLGYNPGDGLDGDKIKIKKELDLINSTFGIPQEFENEYDHQLIIQNLTIRNFNKILNVPRKKTKTIIYIKNPYPLFDTFRFNYDPIRKKWRDEFSKRNHAETSERVRFVDIHIRRAVSPPSTKREKNYIRHMPTNWYLNVLKQIIFLLKENGQNEFSLRIHTDGTGINSPLQPRNLGLDLDTEKLWLQQGILDSDGFLMEYNEDLKSSFEKIGPVEFFQGGVPSKTLKMLIGGDLLIGGKSSFSFVAGLAKPKGKTIFSKFWHKCPNDWMIPNSQGKISSRDIKLFLETLGTKALDTI